MNKIWVIKIGNDKKEIETIQGLKELLNYLITEGTICYDSKDIILACNEINSVLNKSIPDFFKERPALKLMVIADESNISVKTLRKIIYGGNVIVDKGRLIQVLIKYGF